MNCPSETELHYKDFLSQTILQKCLWILSGYIWKLGMFSVSQLYVERETPSPSTHLPNEIWEHSNWSRDADRVIKIDFVPPSETCMIAFPRSYADWRRLVPEGGRWEQLKFIHIEE
ncbi:hypothetical protein MKW92_047999 [Papaver armeniacum]|nr:hypothetical protein MKW92_047999 [Papaver armeniacum]